MCLINIKAHLFLHFSIQLLELIKLRAVQTYYAKIPQEEQGCQLIILMDKTTNNLKESLCCQNILMQLDQGKYPHKSLLA